MGAQDSAEAPCESDDSRHFKPSPKRFSGAWETKRLGEIAHIQTGNRNNQDKDENGQYPFFVRSAIVERINSYSYNGEAILVPGEGDVGNIFHYIKGRFDFHQRVYMINRFAADVCGKLIYYSMALQFGSHAMQNTVKATVDSLRLPTFKNFSMFLPKEVAEQRAIAEVLSDVDGLINALEALIAKKRAIKLATLQQLLTGKTRLPGFSGAWETKRLGEIFSIRVASSKSQYIVDGGKYFIVDMGSVSTDGRLIAAKQTDYEGDFLKTGELVMPKDDIGGGKIIGKVAYIGADGSYVLGDHVYALQLMRGCPRFFSYLINRYKTNRSLRSKVGGSAQLGLSRKAVEEQEIPVPPEAEQRAIAEVLSDMDGEIAALEKWVEKTRAIKQGMMQELLTGRTRLIISDIPRRRK